jgi:hypothetical protein
MLAPQEVPIREAPRAQKVRICSEELISPEAFILRAEDEATYMRATSMGRILPKNPVPLAI